MWLRRAPVLGPHVIRNRLGFDVLVLVVVRVRVVGGPNVLHAVDAAALEAAFDGALAGHLFVGGKAASQRGVFVLEKGREEGRKEREGREVRLDWWGKVPCCA